MDRFDSEPPAEVDWSAPLPRPQPAEPTSLPETHQLPIGDPERLGALFSRLEPRLRSVALRITRHPEAARDAVQSGFEKVLRHGHRFEGQSRVSTWMHRIVANEALMWLRSQRRRAEVQTDDETGPLATRPDPAPGPAESASRRQQAARLQRGLAHLPGDERDVILCCCLDGETYSDYGGRVGVHPAAVKTRAYRARRRLATVLEEPPPGRSA